MTCVQTSTRQRPPKPGVVPHGPPDHRECPYRGALSKLYGACGTSGYSNSCSLYSVHTLRVVFSCITTRRAFACFTHLRNIGIRYTLSKRRPAVSEPGEREPTRYTSVLWLWCFNGGAPLPDAAGGAHRPVAHPAFAGDQAAGAARSSRGQHRRRRRPPRQRMAWGHHLAPTP